MTEEQFNNFKFQKGQSIIDKYGYMYKIVSVNFSCDSFGVFSKDRGFTEIRIENIGKIVDENDLTNFPWWVVPGVIVEHRKDLWISRIYNNVYIDTDDGQVAIINVIKDLKPISYPFSAIDDAAIKICFRPDGRVILEYPDSFHYSKDLPKRIKDIPKEWENQTFAITDNLRS